MTDVLIIGDGPSGLAAAITLRQQGRTVTIAYRKKEHAENRIGESLTSSALFSLRNLDVLEDFLSDGHRPCYGNCSCWGSESLAFYDFIESAVGSGWYIDRGRFNQTLLNKARVLGVQFVENGRNANLVRNKESHWDLQNGVGSVQAKWVIEASGRNFWVGRQLGIERHEEDRQIAVTNLFHTQHAIKSTHSMVEAVADGWWYVAEPSEGLVVVIFFTDPDLHNRAELSDPDHIQKKIKDTKFVKHRFMAQKPKLIGSPVIVAAGTSSKLDHLCTGWIAVGDAACSLDPLTSHGIAFGLRSGIDAGVAIALTLGGSVTAIHEYHDLLREAMAAGREQRQQIYTREMRWNTNEYWQRRNKLVV